MREDMENEAPVTMERAPEAELCAGQMPGMLGAGGEGESSGEVADTLPMYERILAILAARGAPYHIHEHAPSVTIAEADAKLDFPVERLLKSIAFRVKNGGWILAALCGYRQVDYRKLAAVAGVSRDRLMRLEPAEVESDLGYELGGVAPFAPNPETRIVLDQGVLDHATIFCGTGRRDRTLEIAPADLLRVSGAEIALLAKKMVCEG